jgi:hypothetical protein
LVSLGDHALRSPIREYLTQDTRQSQGIYGPKTFWTRVAYALPPSLILQRVYSPYQSECGDHWLQERHCVSVHWCMHAGQTPPVSKVFQALPHLQDHWSSLRGDQPQSGHRMRGPEVSPLLSSAESMTGAVGHIKDIKPSRRALNRMPRVPPR